MPSWWNFKLARWHADDAKSHAHCQPDLSSSVLVCCRLDIVPQVIFHRNNEWTSLIPFCSACCPFVLPSKISIWWILDFDRWHYLWERHGCLSWLVSMCLFKIECKYQFIFSFIRLHLFKFLLNIRRNKTTLFINRYYFSFVHILKFSLCSAWWTLGLSSVSLGCEWKPKFVYRIYKL
jgi:hypothetical protein